MNREAIDTLIAEVIRSDHGGCTADDCNTMALIDDVRKALSPGEPPVEGAIPLEGCWLVDTGELAGAPDTDDDRTLAVVLPDGQHGWESAAWWLTLRGVRVPEPRRRFERGDRVHDPIGDWECEVLAVDGDAAWIRRLDDGTRSTWNVAELRLVDAR